MTTASGKREGMALMWVIVVLGVLAVILGAIAVQVVAMRRNQIGRAHV